MRICHFSSVHDRYDPRVFLKECSSLAKEGYEVIYIVNDENPNEIKNNVHIISTGKKYHNRLLRMLLTLPIIKKMAIEQDADIYHFHDPELIPIGLYLKRKGKIVIDDVHEDVPRDILSKEWIPTGIRKFISKRIENYENRKLGFFDALFTVTPFLMDRLSAINSNCFLVTNYPLLPLNIEKEVVELDDYIKCDKNVCFTGAITSAWQHEVIIDALSEIDCKYLLAGKTIPKYFESLKKLDVRKIINYKGILPYYEVKDIFRVSRVALAIADYRPGAGYRDGTLGNTKLFEYMQVGLPVVCTDFTVWKQILEKYKCGICVSPYDKNAIKEAVEYLLNFPQEAYQMGQNGIRAVEKEFNWVTQEKVLFTVYKRFEACM